MRTRQTAKPRAQTMWAMSQGSLLFCGTFFTRRGAIEDIEAAYGEPWEKLRARGFEPIKVRVEPLP